MRLVWSNGQLMSEEKKIQRPQETWKEAILLSSYRSSLRCDLYCKSGKTQLFISSKSPCSQKIFFVHFIVLPLKPEIEWKKFSFSKYLDSHLKTLDWEGEISFSSHSTSLKENLEIKRQNSHSCLESWNRLLAGQWAWHVNSNFIHIFKIIIPEMLPNGSTSNAWSLTVVHEFPCASAPLFLGYLISHDTIFCSINAILRTCQSELTSQDVLVFSGPLPPTQYQWKRNMYWGKCSNRVRQVRQTSHYSP